MTSKAKEYREIQRQRAAESATELMLPCGVSILVRRVPRAFFIGRKYLPQNLIAKAMEAANGEKLDPLALAKTMSAEEMAAAFRFQQELICAAVVSPKIVIGDSQSDDEMGLHEFSDEDLGCIIAWAMNPNATIDGEAVSAETLEQFRDDGTRGGGGQSGGEVRLQAV